LARELVVSGLPEAPVPFWNAPGSNEFLGLVVCERELLFGVGINVGVSSIYQGTFLLFLKTIHKLKLPLKKISEKFPWCWCWCCVRAVCELAV